MHGRAAMGFGLTLVLATAGQCLGQDLLWRPSQALPFHSEIQTVSSNPTGISLGRPQLVNAPQPEKNRSDSISKPGFVARAQSPDAPPIGGFPPPPPAPGFIPPASPEEAFNCGVATTKPGGSSIFGGFWDKIRGVPKEAGQYIGSVFQPLASQRSLFQSDHDFPYFPSPISTPFLLEDPRALTEFKPIFLWQHTRRSNAIFAGGDNIFVTFQGRLAITDWFSITMNRLGLVWIETEKPAPGFANSFGFGEFWIGPKFTFYRNPDSATVLAAGLTFQAPVGSSRVLQNTGTLTLDPYFSVAQRIWRFQQGYGSINLMNTTGMALSVNTRRTNYFHTSLHLDYNIGDLNKFFPMVELHWIHYTRNGRTRDISFEGSDLFNFGSNGTAGRDEFRIAPGFRYQHNRNLGFGVAGEWGLLGGGRHMDGFRLTVDMILRY